LPKASAVQLALHQAVKLRASERADALVRADDCAPIVATPEKLESYLWILAVAATSVVAPAYLFGTRHLETLSIRELVSALALVALSVAAHFALSLRVSTSVRREIVPAREPRDAFAFEWSLPLPLDTAASCGAILTACLPVERRWARPWGSERRSPGGACRLLSE
jgi:hypothetical protein